MLAAVQQYGEGAAVTGDGTSAVTVTGPALPAQTFTTASSAPASRWPAPGTGNSNNSAADNTTSPASTTVNVASTHDYTDSYRLGTFGDTGRTGLVIWDGVACPTVHGGDFQVLEYPTTDATGIRSYLTPPEVNGRAPPVHPRSRTTRSVPEHGGWPILTATTSVTWLSRSIKYFPSSAPRYFTTPWLCTTTWGTDSSTPPRVSLPPGGSTCPTVPSAT